MRTRFAVKRTAIYLLMLAAVLALCSCRVSRKSDLIRYAKSNYGDCEYISQDHTGSGNDEVRTVYLKDKETGIEYSVTSSMSSIVIDGSVFGHQEYKSSDFDTKYQAYLLDKADSGLSDLAEEYGFSFDPETGIYKLSFDSRESGDNAKKAVKEVDKLLAKYDTKNLRPMNYLLYVEDNVYIGTYDASTGEYTKSNEFDIIDYVHENYDPDAVSCFLQKATVCRWELHTTSGIKTVRSLLRSILMSSAQMPAASGFSATIRTAWKRSNIKEDTCVTTV